jgi:hypothetical protein
MTFAMAYFHKLLLLSLSLSLFVAAAPLNDDKSSQTSACQQLEEKFGNQTSSLGSNEYVAGVLGM